MKTVKMNTYVSSKDAAIITDGIGCVDGENKNLKSSAPANAALIAAAPDLLMIVERLVSDGLSTSLVQEARKTINKAKGS